MTVSSIVQKLLEKNHITASEALVLLKAESINSNFLISPCAPYGPHIKPYVGPPSPAIGSPPIWYSSGTSKQENIGWDYTNRRYFDKDE